MVYKKILGLVIVLFFIACHSSVKRVGEHNLGISKEDSTALANLFQSAMGLQGADKDSVLKAAKYIAVKSEANQFWYRAQEYKYLINTGKGAEQVTPLENEIAAFAKDTFNIRAAYYYNLLGAAYAHLGTQEKSIAFYEKAARAFDANKNKRQAAVVNQNIANVFFSKLDYEAAYKYCLKARQTFFDLQDTFYMPLNESISAISAMGIKRYEEAEQYAKNGLALSLKYHNKMSQIFSTFALADVSLHKNQYEEAIKLYLEAKQLSEQYKFPGLMMQFHTALSKVYGLNGNFEQSKENGLLALAEAEKRNSEHILYSIHKYLAYAYEGLGETKNAFDHLKIAEERFRTIQEENNQKVIQELLLKYEDEQKANIILTQKNNLFTQRVWIFVIGGIALLLLILFFWRQSVYRHKQKLLKQENDTKLLHAVFTGEEKERKRLADELHNGIASNLVAIKLQLENLDAIPEQSDSLQKVLGIVTKTHQETRHIAHNLLPVDFSKQSFADIIKHFCESCSTANLKVNFSTNVSDLELEVAKAMVLYRSVQECVQNALKHANATRVDVQLIDHKERIAISVEDDGKGFDSNFVNNNNQGLKAMHERLNELDIDISIDSDEGSGTSVFIEFKK